MSPSFTTWDDQTFDLAVERFTVGIDERDCADLDRRATKADLDEFESVLAAIHLSSLPVRGELPSDVQNRLEHIGRVQVHGSDQWQADTQSASPTAWLGWVAAAAAVLVLMLNLNEPVEPGAAVARRRLLERDANTLQVAWVTTEDVASRDAAGDVVWSKGLQEGYMRFEGLEPNDPTKSQYQLWIFDTTRADWEAKPVDGGVFDVGSSGEVVVPIDAKLVVDEAALFAITIEVPGGVVVSERERLVLTASP